MKYTVEVYLALALRGTADTVRLLIMKTEFMRRGVPMIKFMLSVTVCLVCGISPSLACPGEKEAVSTESSCASGELGSCGEGKQVGNLEGSKGECGSSECKRSGDHQKGCGCSKSEYKGERASGKTGCGCVRMKEGAKYSECQHHSDQKEFHVAKGNACTGDVDCCCWRGECLGASPCCKGIRCAK